jgi:hypothetical protein
MQPPLGGNVGFAETGRRYVLELKPPTGWHIPDAPMPEGGLRLTVGGLPPHRAPASFMVRAVDEDGLTFEGYCQREFESMQRHIPDGRVTDVLGVDFPGQRWMSKQVVNAQRGAIVTIVETHDHFLWFGLLINDPSELDDAPKLYRDILASFHERVTSLFGEPVNILPV